MRDWTHDVRARLAPLKLAPAHEADIAEELAQHLEDRFNDLRSRGASEDDAAARTLAELEEEGGALSRALRSVPRDVEVATVDGGPDGQRFWDQALQDIRYALRSFRRRPGFAIVAITMLALGIGANTAIFSLVNAALIRKLPVKEPERLAYLYRNDAPIYASYPDYVDLRDKNDVLTDLVAWGGIGVSLSDESSTDLVSGAIVTGNFFDVVGISPALGRLLQPSDDVTPGAHPVAVISHKLWRTRFAGRRDVIGSRIRLNSHPFTIVGVAPADFPSAEIGTQSNVFVPIMMQAVVRPPRSRYSGEMNPDLLNVRTNGWLGLLARRKPEVTWTQAEASLSAFAEQLWPNPQRRNPIRIGAIGIHDGDPQTRERMTSVARLLLAVVGAVLLIACVNVANLLLARASSRQREIAVRLSLGASRGRLVRQLLTESLVLASLGGAAGLALGWGVIRALSASPPPPGALPIEMQFALDGTVLLFTASLALMTALLFGLAPAVSASRPDLVSAVKSEAGAASAGRGRRFGLSGTLVAAQMGLSLLLLVASGLFVRSLQRVTSIEPGFDADRLVTAPVSVNILRYTRTASRQFYANVVTNAAAIPGIESAALARSLPLTGFSRTNSLQVEGKQPNQDQFTSEGAGRAPSGLTSTNVNSVSVGYFRTLGIPLQLGRDFAITDDSGSTAVAIINREFVRRHFPSDDPLGKRLSIRGPEGPWLTIIGVVGDAKQGSLDERPLPMVYQTLLQNHETGVTLIARAAAGVPPNTLVRPMVRVIQSLEPNLPVANARPMSDVVDVSVYSTRAGATLLSVFGGLAILLAAVGLYGVMAFTVARRTREIGVRMALGASGRTVLGGVLREGLLLSLAGVAIGLVASVWWSGALRRFLNGISPFDPATFIGVAGLLLLVSVLATLIPARRAAKVDPIIAMRSS
jgi:predicted permease